MNIGPTDILLVFALYLLARWQYVKRPLFYLVGVGGLVFAFLSGFFVTAAGGATVASVFGTIGTLVALLGFVGACYGAQLPINLPGDNQKQNPTNP